MNKIQTAKHNAEIEATQETEYATYRGRTLTKLGNLKFMFNVSGLTVFMLFVPYLLTRAIMKYVANFPVEIPELWNKIIDLNRLSLDYDQAWKFVKALTNYLLILSDKVVPSPDLLQIYHPPLLILGIATALLYAFYIKYGYTKIDYKRFTHKLFAGDLLKKNYSPAPKEEFFYIIDANQEKDTYKILTFDTTLKNFEIKEANNYGNILTDFYYAVDKSDKVALINKIPTKYKELIK